MKSIWKSNYFRRNFTYEEKLRHFNGIYDDPLVHVGPYFIGIFYGYCIFNSERRVRINSILLTIGENLPLCPNDRSTFPF